MKEKIIRGMFILLFTAIDACEAHRRVPVLFDRTLFLEAYETLYVTIAITQLHGSRELRGRECGAPSPRVHLDSLPYYLTLTGRLKWQRSRRLVSGRLYCLLIWRGFLSRIRIIASRQRVCSITSR